MRSYLYAPILLVGLLALPTSAAVPPTSSETWAVLNGHEIPAGDVHRYHCHDGAYPEIRCFDDEQSRDQDGAASGASGKVREGDLRDATSEGTASHASEPTAMMATSTTYYVTFYEHANYGGASYTASQSISNLGDWGWNDHVTSFKSLNGQRPKWWENAGYTPPTWQWAASAWVSNVGSAANDRFSSVANVP